ncbi:hypothetical protein C8T65DRAFT_832766, partial [Cerioporus squamosus]
MPGLADSTYIRIAHQRFLDRFWPVPPPDSVHFKTPQFHSTSPLSFMVALQEVVEGPNGHASVQHFVQAVHEHNLAEGFQLKMLPKVVDSYDTWGYMERLEDERPDWAKPQVIFRFCDEDPFTVLDSSRTCEYEEEDPDYCQAVRDAIATVVQERFAVRFLTAVYVVIVHGSGIRLSHWDPSGTVFSTRVNYVKNPDSFADIFCRISMLTDEQLGLDPTASPVFPDSDEYSLLNRLAAPREDDYPLVQGAVVEGDPADSSRMFQFLRARYANYVHYPTGPFANIDARWKIAVPLADGSSRHFLVAGAMQYETGPNPDRRNGRAYFAVDCLTERVVFLKDTWRHTDYIEREGRVLAALNAAGVPHVPKLLCEADLPGQETWTLTVLDTEEEPRCNTSAYVSDTTGFDADDGAVYESDDTGGTLVHLRHYRLVIADLCHSQAVELTSWIHGDISLPNLMVYPYVEVSETGMATIQYSGVLIDWELSRPVDIPESRVSKRQMTRRTWEFVSYKYCSDPRIGLSIGGDLESFFYVLLHFAVWFLRSNVEDRDHFLQEFCSVYTMPRSHPGTTFISEHKTSTLYNGVLTTGARSCILLVFYADSGERARTPLNGLLNNLLWLFHASFLLYERGEQATMAPRPPVRPGPFFRPYQTDHEPADGLVLASDVAGKLWDHAAVLEMFDDALKKPWTTDDWAYPPLNAVHQQAEQGATEDTPQATEEHDGCADTGTSSHSDSKQSKDAALTEDVLRQKDLEMPLVQVEARQEAPATNSKQEK